MAASSVLGATMGVAHAGEVPRDVYLKQVPLGRPRLVQQTEASAALHLFGDREDPAYSDESPVDGIDDRRHDALMALAVRFAPFLVQNTSDCPTNFDAYIDAAETFPLHVDTWDITSSEPELVGSDSLDFAAVGREACGAAGTDDANADCRLLDLLDRHAPGGRPRGNPEDDRVRPRPHRTEVLFFDLPGEGPATWSQGYEAAYARLPEEKRRFFPHAYVHPFLRDTGDAPGGYELVFQYWLFYPSNDSGMNHEGDWEHLNVVIAPRSLVDRPVPAATIEDILTGGRPPTDDAADPLVIRRVDYYFHHLVMSLDFSSPNVYLPRKEWKAEVDEREPTRFQEVEIWKDIRHLAYVDDDETTVNTHPLGYIGADNKGFDQLLAPPGGANRNPHGSYPLPGRYMNVGPGGTTDEISVYVDPRRHWKKLQSGKATTGPEFERGSVLGLADPDRLRIVPDWERVIDLVREDHAARRDWSWLVLPVRWGYPVTLSPFAGVLEHFDTGNVSVLGPSFNGGWNVSGPGAGFQRYDPHTLPSVFPLGLQASFRNDLGFLNVGVVVFNLPPLDFITRIAAYPFKLALKRRDPVFYPEDGLPFRSVGVSSGVSIQVLDDNFDALALNSQQFEEFLVRIVAHLIVSNADSTTTPVAANSLQDDPVGPFLQVPFYVGSHFTSENMLRNVRSTFGIDIDFNNIPSYSYRAELNLWEYAGSIRYSLTTSRLQPFVKGGYGWAWYRLENVRANDVPFEPAESGWIKPKHIWPNVWHFGAGIEYVPWKRIGRYFHGTEIALRLEYVRYSQALGLDLSGVPLENLGLVFGTLGDVPGTGRVSRDDFLFGLTVSF